MWIHKYHLDPTGWKIHSQNTALRGWGVIQKGRCMRYTQKYETWKDQPRLIIWKT